MQHKINLKFGAAQACLGIEQAPNLKVKNGLERLRALALSSFNKMEWEGRGCCEVSGSKELLLFFFYLPPCPLFSTVWIKSCLCSEFPSHTQFGQCLKKTQKSKKAVLGHTANT